MGLFRGRGGGGGGAGQNSLHSDSLYGAIMFYLTK